MDWLAYHHQTVERHTTHFVQYAEAYGETTSTDFAYLSDEFGNLVSVVETLIQTADLERLRRFLWAIGRPGAGFVYV